MMRIIVNGLSARLGGGQTYLINILKRVPQERGWKIFLLCPDSVDLNGMPDNVERIRVKHNLENPFTRTVWEHFYLGRIARDLGADLLFCPGGLLPMGLPPDLKTAVTFQNMLPFDHNQRERYPFGYRRLRDWLLERAFSSSMRRSDLVVFISRFAKEFIIENLGALNGQQFVIPHGVDPCFFPVETGDARSIASHTNSGAYFLYVSFIDYYKSQIEVVQAFAKVREHMRKPATLLLVGAENASYGKHLRREIAVLGLENSVRLIGNLPHASLPALYQNAQINLFASRTENCPNIMLEMMASGRPALVSNRGPMPEFGMQDVIYFDPANHEQLADRWIELIRQPLRGEQLALQAMKRISSLTWDSASHALWSAMREPNW